MILGISTSSPQTSVACFSDDGDLLWAEAAMTKLQSDSYALDFIQRRLSRDELSNLTLCLADIGPGSFTGVRAGVVIAKTLAHTFGVECAGADAFDLISPSETAAFPSKKGEYFIRRVGTVPIRTTEKVDESLVGFGPWFAEADQVFPAASRFGPLIPNLIRMRPEDFSPEYLIEPSISLPKGAVHA